MTDDKLVLKMVEMMVSCLVQKMVAVTDVQFFETLGFQSVELMVQSVASLKGTIKVVTMVEYWVFGMAVL
jgi:hypothetical protein